MKEVDIIISGCLVVTMDKEFKVYEDGFIAIEENHLVAIGESDLSSQFKANTIIDGKDKLAMPGLINTHTHAPMVYFRGYADDLPLKEWLEAHIWPLERKFVNPDFVKEAVKLAALEMLKSGTTTFLDMYFAENEMAYVLKDIGIRSFLGEGILGFPTPVSPTPEAGLKRTEELIKNWKDDELISPVVSPHAPYTCSEELLRLANGLARDYDVPLHIHLAEEKWEVEKIQAEKGMSPVEYLNNLGLLREKTSAAHVNWVSKKDIEILAQTKTGVAHNPESNMKLATGICPVPDMLKAGIKVGLGTDSATSNNNLDMFGEMDMAAKLHKITRKNPTVLKAKEVVRMATVGGAEVLGVANKIGSLEPNKKADLILLNLNQPHLVPLYDVYSQIVYAASGSDVNTIIVNGKILIKERKALTIDEEEVINKAKEFSKKLQTGVRHQS